MVAESTMPSSVISKPVLSVSNLAPYVAGVQLDPAATAYGFVGYYAAAGLVGLFLGFFAASDSVLGLFCKLLLNVIVILLFANAFWLARAEGVAIGMKTLGACFVCVVTWLIASAAYKAIFDE